MNVAAHAAMFVHRQNSMIAAQNAARLRASNAALVPRANLVVATLAPDLLRLLGVDTHAEKLMLKTQGEHIRSRREHQAVALITAIPNALIDVKYYGRRIGGENVYSVVGEAGLGKLVLVGIKFVPARRARSGSDEAWVTTVHFLREKELRRLLRDGRVQPHIRTSA